MRFTDAPVIRRTGRQALMSRSGAPRATMRCGLRVLRSLRKPVIPLAITRQTGHRLLALRQCRIPAIARPRLAFAAKRIIVSGRWPRSKKRECHGGRSNKKNSSHHHGCDLRRGGNMIGMIQAFARAAQFVKQRMSERARQPLRDENFQNTQPPLVLCGIQLPHVIGAEISHHAQTTKVIR